MQLLDHNCFDEVHINPVPRLGAARGCRLGKMSLSRLSLPVHNDDLSFLNFGKMSSSNQYLVDNSPYEPDDSDSVASNATDDGQTHLPEKILARQDIKHNNQDRSWYLVKWENCPILRSSWETGDLFQEYPKLLQDWDVEQQRRVAGEGVFDLEAFNKAVADLETAYTRRRQLRRLKKDVRGLLQLTKGP